MSTDFVYLTIEFVARTIRLRNELAELDRMTGYFAVTLYVCPSKGTGPYVSRRNTVKLD